MDIEALRRAAEAPVKATASDAASVASDLADAFAGDVLFDWFMRADHKRDSARLRFFRLLISEFAVKQGHIDRPVMGGAAAVWMPFESLSPIPLRDELRALPVLLHATGFARFTRLTATRADMDKHHPMDRPHAYLWFLGVTHAAQGHGVGSRLLRVGVDRLDAAGQPAYLETQTERNLSLYRRHGFEVISEHRPRRDAPPLWSMWREPAA